MADVAHLGKITAELMEFLDEKLGPEDTVGAVMVLVEVDSPDTNTVLTVGTDPRVMFQLGMLDLAQWRLRSGPGST